MKNHQKLGRIAILVADGFEQVELTEPRKALETHGFRTEIVSPKASTVKGMSRATSRKPEDIPAFNRGVIKLFGADTKRRR